MAEKIEQICPLCLAPNADFFHEDRLRIYFRCSVCGLVSVPPAQHPAPEDEKAQYDLHENDPADEGYRRFLGKLCAPMCARIAPDAEGLDFGCGPGPALARMFRESGRSCALYDPFYFPDRQALARQYDFISCTEAAEHFSSPHREFGSLFSLLKPGGLLGIMTQPFLEARTFACWHYKADPTHIMFYAPETFDWLAARYGCTLENPERSVFLLRAVPPSGT